MTRTAVDGRPVAQQLEVGPAAAASESEPWELDSDVRPP